jgi:heptosyltransferase III
MKSILVFRPGAIGDALLAFPVLKALREQYAGTRITLVSNAQVIPLAQAFGVAEQIFDFQDIQWSELFSSNGIHTSSMHDLLAQTDLAICWMRDLDGIIGYNIKASGVKQCIIAPGRPYAGTDLHVIDYLAQTIGLPNVGTLIEHKKSPSTSVGARVDEGWLGGPLWSPVGGVYGPFIDQPTTSGGQWLETLNAHDMSTNRFVAIHPGSGALEKCWPTSRFAEVIKQLWEQNRTVLLLAGPADTERVNDLLQQLPLPPNSEMLNVLANAPLLEVAQHIQQCRCYLGNDSGITHLAAMLGVPTVAIFGPTDPKIWRPVGPFVNVIHEPRLEHISVDAVLDAIFA